MYDRVGAVIFLLLAVYLLYLLILVIRRKKLPFVLQIIYIWFVWGYLAIFIHGSPPIHYFVPLLPAPIILFSLLLDKISARKAGFVISSLIVILFSCLNVFYLIKSNWYFPRNNVLNQKPFYVPYLLQQEVARSIVKDVNGRKYALRRVGPNDQFEGDYAQNYIYLLWLYGNEPVKNAEIVYTIYEVQNGIPEQKTSEKKMRVSNITIIKKY
jgi:hypothetical protein